MKEKINKLIGIITANLSFILVLLGISSIVYASFLFNTILGFIILGLALVLVAYIISPNKE